jgi:hypothetical protein
MATRMQQRRGTASQWTSANPVLNAGEMGWESDTNKFKIGDGTNHWADLDYFIDANSTVNPAFGTSIVFEGATADSYETTLQVTDPTADRTITFPDATGTVALTSDIAELSQDAIDAALTAGTGITKTYNDAANTLTLAVDTTVIATKAELAEVAQDSINDALVAGTGITKSYNDAANTLTLSVDTTTIQARVADVSDTEIGYLNGVTSAIQTQLDTKAPTANASFTGTFSAPTGTITSTMIADGTIVDGDINASAAIAQSKISGLTTDLGLKAPLASPTFTGTVTVPTPVNSTDATTKAYVDAVTEGLHIHPSVIAATTANVNLASALENGDTLDGVTLATNDRVLVKNQTTTSENGIYVVQASGQPTRATDFDTALEVDSGDFVFVTSGTANASTGWVQTNKPATIGTDPILFTQFAGAGTYTAGTGLTLNGTVFSANIGTDIQAYNSTLASVAGGTYTGDDSITTLGTITSGTWNGTTIAVANGGTGITSLGTGIADFLGTPSSANLIAAVTDETGTGSLVFGTSPSFTTSLTLNATGELRLADTDSTHYVGFKSPGTVSSNRIWTLPAADGTTGQTLSTDGSGVLQWSTPAQGAAFSELMLIGA